VGRLVTEGGGKILVDEADLWPAGECVTTQLIVAGFLKDHKDVVEAGEQSVRRTSSSRRTRSTPRPTCRTASLASPAKHPGRPVIASFKNIQFTDDPIATSLVKNNRAQQDRGLASADSLKGIYDLSFSTRP
jgi:NitT/TauT family transport system substrate-binding protein